jgi:hypothetical protein
MEQGRKTGGSNAERALQLVRALGCKRVFIYAMAIEPWAGPLGGSPLEPDSFQDRENRAFIRECRALGIEAELLDGSRSIVLDRDRIMRNSVALA